MSVDDTGNPAEAFAEWYAEQTQPAEQAEPAPEPEQTGPRTPRPNMAQGQGGPPLVAPNPAQAFADALAALTPTRVADGGAWLDTNTGHEVVVPGRWVPPTS